MYNLRETLKGEDALRSAGEGERSESIKMPRSNQPFDRGGRQNTYDR